MEKKLSVVLATFNEEGNLPATLTAVKDIVDEIVVVDGSSIDKTREIAESFGAKVLKVKNQPIFHINKQIALENASGEWILQLDADEIVSSRLAKEIEKILAMSDDEIERYQQTLPEKRLFLHHQSLVEKRDGKVGTGGKEYTAFFIPRKNLFLGKYLRYGGVYPDGVIRLVKNGKSYFPAKSVHEQIVINGKVGWLANPLLHMDSPTFRRYIQRNSRYIDLIRDELKKEGSKNPIFALDYLLVKPIWWFLMTQLRHKGILDGWQGVVFSFFSALRFPRAYIRYLKN